MQLEKINVFPLLHKMFFLLEVKKWICLPHRGQQNALFWTTDKKSICLLLTLLIKHKVCNFFLFLQALFLHNEIIIIFVNYCSILYVSILHCSINHWSIEEIVVKYCPVLHCAILKSHIEHKLYYISIIQVIEKALIITTNYSSS